MPRRGDTGAATPGGPQPPRLAPEPPRPVLELPRLAPEPPRPVLELPRLAPEPPRPVLELPRLAPEPPRPALEPPGRAPEPPSPVLKLPRLAPEPPRPALELPRLAPEPLRRAPGLPRPALEVPRPATSSGCSARSTVARSPSWSASSAISTSPKRRSRRHSRPRCSGGPERAYLPARRDGSSPRLGTGRSTVCAKTRSARTGTRRPLG